MINKMFNRMLHVVVIIVFTVCTYFGYQIIIKGNRMPMLFGYSSSVIVSGSMKPTVDVGDLIITHSQTDYYVGDVVVFRSGENFIMHRIVEKTDEGFVTRGDANNVNDNERLMPENIIGRQVFQIHGIGKTISFLKTPAGFVLFAVFSVMIFRLSVAVKELMKKHTVRSEQSGG